MGMQQPFDFDTGWEQAAELLDRDFPLADGSHRDAACYLVHCGHLMVISEKGFCTGLARPGQFVDSDGDDGAPDSIVLRHGGIQVEIEPGPCRPNVKGVDRGHRMQLLGELAIA